MSVQKDKHKNFFNKFTLVNFKEFEAQKTVYFLLLALLINFEKS